jgi:hypothetical protein
VILQIIITKLTKLENKVELPKCFEKTTLDYWIKFWGIHGMIYLQMLVMKKLLPVLRPVTLLGIGLIMAVLSAAVGTISPDMGGNNLSTAAHYLQTTSATPTVTGDTSRVGSTDGIVLMGIVIVLIIVIPILFRQKTWSK